MTTKRVLVVDDDRDLCRVIADALEDAGFDVRLAHNGSQALNAMAADPFSMLVLDLVMPVMDGWAVLRERTASPTLSAVPVLVLSGAREDGLRAAKELGAAFLVKPFDLDVLVMMVEQISQVAQERARLEGVLMATRTIEHHLNNQLALTLGHSELLASDPRLPEPLRQEAQIAAEGVLKASEILQRLRNITRAEGVESLVGSVVNLADD